MRNLFLLIAILLASATLSLFYFDRPKESIRPMISPQKRLDLQTTHLAIDQQVDTLLLRRFFLDKSWIKKKQIPVPETEFTRIERKVFLSPDTMLTMVNIAFNTMARQFNARAIGSENTREHTMTIHIAYQGSVMQTILLIPTRDLKRTVEKVGANTSISNRHADVVHRKKTKRSHDSQVRKHPRKRNR